MQPDQRKKSSVDVDFFTEYGEGSRYRIEEVIGKGSYGVVCSAYDTHIGEKVAIKKINDIFEHVSDATRILREIKLLRLLRHPDIVEIKHILLPPSRREFKDIYVVFELMESDLHQVIKANDDLTPEHYQFFLYQLLRGLKYIHTANVFHRDLKPKNILANADCKLKICDFGLARVAFNDTPTAIFWTDYVATRWYRAPELCGSFFSKYTPAIDIWSIGCIFAELLTGKPLFPGKNVVHQLDLMTDLLGTPSAEAIARVRNEKARRYLSSMRKKKPIPFSQKFPNADPLALRLLEKMLAFEPKDRPTAEEALADPYFKGLAKVEREPSAQPVTKMEFEFERRRITKEDVRELIYREILEYHPNMLKEYLEGAEPTGFMYPSAVDHFKKQFAYLEEHYGNGATAAPPERQHASLPRPCVLYSDNTVQNSLEVSNDLYKCSIKEIGKPHMDQNGGIPMTRLPLHVPQSIQGAARPGKVVGSVMRYNNCGVAATAEAHEQRRVVRNPTISTQYTASNCSYPRRNPVCKNERREDEGVEGSNGLQPKPQYMARKVAAAQGGSGNHWY
ncbi:mitogen-activated protein kinase 15 isoform X2 [Hevea brasiliensis]|uniref:mitogen-activated protein kinase 15 isoform X2 n=1 Tax=Hevea brasiliensis TaxID=3981 RepID=UPI0025CDB036|nr:mitogen-activated protein kinase 15 isoform X2 [Hevea brasiliensis]